MYGTVAQVIERLSREPADTKLLTRFWYAEDVNHALIDQGQPALSEADANKALFYADKAHDANIGVNIESLVAAAEFVMENPVDLNGQ